MYAKGEGTQIDTETSNHYYSIAISGFEKLVKDERADDNTYYKLARMYSKGHGTQINMDKAVKYWKKACEAGNVNALYDYAKALMYGEGIEKDCEKAVELLKQAISKDSLNAKRLLANEYLTGEHLNQDAAHGIELLKECAAEGDASSNYKLGKIFNEGLFGAEEDPAEAQQYFSCAFREYRKLEEENKLTESAALILGNMCEKGLGTNIDIDAAIRYYSFSADNGNEYAQYAVGRLYLTDDHFNAELAEKYLKLSAEQGNSYGQLGLGILYNRLGNKKLSDYWIRQAADNGNEFAQKIIDSRLHPVEHSNQYQSAISNLTGATFSALKQIYNKLNAQVNKLLAEAERDEMIDNQRFRKY